MNQITAAYVLAFFRKYLRGTDDHSLDGPPPRGAEVCETMTRSHRFGSSKGTFRNPRILLKTAVSLWGA